MELFKQTDTLEIDDLDDKQGTKLASVAEALTGIFMLTKGQEEIEKLIEKLESKMGSSAKTDAILQKKIESLRAKG